MKGKSKKSTYSTTFGVDPKISGFRLKWVFALLCAQTDPDSIHKKNAREIIRTFFNTQKGGRTLMTARSTDFESVASANSAIWAF